MRYETLRRPEAYFKTLEAEGIRGVRPFREIGAMGIRYRGCAAGYGRRCCAVVSRKKIRKIVKQEIETRRSPYGLVHGISFF